MRHAGLEETQAGIKIAGRNINNLRYADDTTLMAESEKELKSLLMEVKEESEKVGLNSTFRKLRSWQKQESSRKTSALLTMTWNNRLIPNRKRSTSRLYIVTLLI